MTVVISVVRDFDIYERLVRGNPNWIGCDFCPFDNRYDNLAISRRYNSFLDSYDYSKPAWFVFCHEDFELLSKIDFERLDKQAIYGPIGTSFVNSLKGCILNSNRDGSYRIFNGSPIIEETQVSTLDCLCMMIHSSVIDKYHVRFDEKLRFDLYVEDLCITLHETHGLKTYALPMKSQHYSFGNPGEQFLQSYAYLAQKYHDIPRVYYNTLGRRCGRMIRDISPKMPEWFQKRKFGIFIQRMTSAGFLEVAINLFNFLDVVIFRFRLYDPKAWKKNNPGTI